jgi:spore germination protein KA
MFKKLFGFLDKLKFRNDYTEESDKENINLKHQPLERNLEHNLSLFEKIYSIPENADVKIRQFYLNGIQKKAAIIYISSITDTKMMEDSVIKPLMANQDASIKIEDLLSANSVHSLLEVRDILKQLNSGNCALFMDGEAKGYSIGVSNFEGRSIEKPENEVSLKGPKEAFNEKAMTNISLLRKKIRNESLIVESMTVSKRDNNDVFIVYVKDLANKELLQTIKKKIQAIDMGSVHNLSILEQLIEERPKSFFPTILNTERPDRAANFLDDGYIVLLMDNSPTSLVLPATFWSFYHTSDDRYLRFLYGNFTRLIRAISLFISLLVSSIYIAITNFHAEMLPPELLLAISATREKVPFPVLVEVILMEGAFELIREAGLRVPNPIGPTIGIVGALILGQAAVQANVVSPLVVIIVALSGLSSFAIGDISMNFAIRLSRFLLLIGAGFLGIYGITAVFTVGLFYVSSIRSFGVPYLAPMTPRYISSSDTIFRKLISNEYFRPGYLKPKDVEKKAGDN